MKPEARAGIVATAATILAVGATIEMAAKPSPAEATGGGVFGCKANRIVWQTERCRPLVHTGDTVVDVFNSDRIAGPFTENSIFVSRDDRTAYWVNGAGVEWDYPNKLFQWFPPVDSRCAPGQTQQEYHQHVRDRRAQLVRERMGKTIGEVEVWKALLKRLLVVDPRMCTVPR